VQIALITTLYIWPPLIGIFVAFRRRPDRWEALGALLAIAPVLVSLLASMMLSDQAMFNLSDLSIILITTLIAGLFYFLTRRIAKPFSESWREYRENRVEETFK